MIFSLVLCAVLQWNYYMMLLMVQEFVRIVPAIWKNYIGGVRAMRHTEWSQVLLCFSHLSILFCADDVFVLVVCISICVLYS